MAARTLTTILFSVIINGFGEEMEDLGGRVFLASLVECKRERIKAVKYHRTACYFYYRISSLA